MKFNNPTTQRIYDIISDDIAKSNKGGSTISNSEIWKILGTTVSINSVRDKVQGLIKKGYFKANYEFWIGTEYHNRMIYPKNK
jgi:hypothetical protein